MQGNKGRERRERTRGGRGTSLVASHVYRAESAPSFSAGVNPLFDTQRSMSPPNEGVETAKKTEPAKGAATAVAAKPRPAVGGGAAARRQRSSDSTPMARRKRAASPQSTATTSTTQSDSSRRHAATAGAASRVTQQSPPQVAKPKSYSRSAPVSRNGSVNMGMTGGGSSKKEEFIPAPLVPAVVAPVPPPPSKRKAAAVDIETGEATGEVLEDAPDKTIMEMLQTYLKRQDLYTRIVLVVVLLVLAGGVMGAYVVILWFAIDGKNTKYIVLVSIFSVVLFWVLWKVRFFFFPYI